MVIFWRWKVSVPFLMSLPICLCLHESLLLLKYICQNKCESETDRLWFDENFQFTKKTAFSLLQASNAPFIQNRRLRLGQLQNYYCDLIVAKMILFQNSNGSDIDKQKHFRHIVEQKIFISISTSLSEQMIWDDLVSILLKLQNDFMSWNKRKMIYQLIAWKSNNKGRHQIFSTITFFAPLSFLLIFC